MSKLTDLSKLPSFYYLNVNVAISGLKVHKIEIFLASILRFVLFL